MARYRKVDVRVWNDGKFKGLSRPAPNAQTLWFFLLTGPQTTNIPGLFSMGESAMAEALGWGLPAFRKAFTEIAAAGMVKWSWEDRLVWIPNAAKYDPPQSPNVIRNWKMAWDEIPECALKTEAFFSMKAFTEGLGKGFREAFREAFGKGYVESPQRLHEDPSPNQEQEQEPEQEQEQPKAADLVFDHWRKVMGKGGRTEFDDKRRGRVEARLDGGYSVPDLFQAIEGCKLTPYNMGQNDKGQPFNDLELICRDASHVDRFMENARNPPRPDTNAKGRASNADKDWTAPVATTADGGLEF
jgi:hypothetical protein